MKKFEGGWTLQKKHNGSKGDCMHERKTKLTAAREKIKDYLHHSYLQAYVTSPIIDEDKLLIFLSIFEKLELHDRKVQNYAVTAMLVQIALDTHERVENGELSSNKHKSRQLMILAGTYYSGLYYKILAELDEIGLIRALAEGIKEVNEHKISVYRKTIGAVDILMESVKKIESSLYERMLNYFGKKHWIDDIAHILFFKRLSNEKQLFLAGKQSIVFDGLTLLFYPDDSCELLSDAQRGHLLNICDTYLTQSAKMIEKNAGHTLFMNDLLFARIQKILDEEKLRAKTYVEEGQ